MTRNTSIEGKGVWPKAHTIIPWILSNLAIGLAGGIAAGWGPLAGAWPVVVVLGVGGALLGGAIAWWTAYTGRRRWMLLGYGVILVLVAMAALVPLYRAGMLAPPGETRKANFERLWRAMAYAYPYFEEKGVDWQAMHDRYYSEAAQAENDEAYWQVTAHLLAELNDGHTGLLSPSARSGRHYFATCRDVEGVMVVDQLNTMARDAGLKRGDVVLAVDGRPIEEVLAALSPMLRDGSTPQQRRAHAAFNVLSTTTDSLTVTVTGSSGERTVDLVWPTGSQPPAPATAKPLQPLITGERLPSGLGLIRIPTFSSSNHDLVAEFDAALQALWDAPGIILDLRDNGGGTTMVSDPIAGRFLDRPFTYGREYYRARLPQRGWRRWYDYRIQPRTPVYNGRLTLLIGENTYSTAENFVVALVDSGRASTVGRQTGGGSGNPISFALSGGGQARFSTGDFRRNDGAPLEGVGITPDLPVSWTVEDISQNHDPDLAAAERLLRTDLKAKTGQTTE